MFTTFNGVMNSSQFILFQDYITENRQLDIKEVENLIAIIKKLKAYVKRVKASGNNPKRVYVLIKFQSNGTEIKDIELINIKYLSK